MTEVVGSTKQVGQGLTQKTFNYEPLGALVDIVTNAAGMCAIFCPEERLADSDLRPSCLCSSSEDDKRWRKFLNNSVVFSNADACQSSCQLSHGYCVINLVSLRMHIVILVQHSLCPVPANDVLDLGLSLRCYNSI